LFTFAGVGVELLFISTRVAVVQITLTFASAGVQLEVFAGHPVAVIIVKCAS